MINGYLNVTGRPRREYLLEMGLAEIEEKLMYIDYCRELCESLSKRC